MTEPRVSVLHCPYCGEGDLRRHTEGHGAWECRSCVRIFTVYSFPAPVGKAAS
jgi:ribosomal protein L37AE/L43A